jgi:hypothetical protein
VSEPAWWEWPQWCSHCNRDVTYFGHASDCPDYITHAVWGSRITEAVAAEREACCRDVCGQCAGINPTYGPAIFEQPPLGTMPPFWQHPNVVTGNPWDAVPCHAAAIRTRVGGSDRGA